MNIRLLSLFLFFLFSIQGYSQNKILKKRISISVVDTKIEYVLTQISLKGNFYFSYNSELFRADSLISLTKENETVENIIIEILGENIIPLESGSYIILKRKSIKEERKRLVENKKKNAKYQINGYIYNIQTGERIETAGIYQIGQTNASLSDIYGNYNLIVSTSLNEIGFAFSAKNFADTVIVICPADTTIVVGLTPLNNTKETEEIVELKNIPISAPEIEFEQIPLVEFAVRKNKFDLVENLQFIENKHFQVSVIPGISTNKLMSGNVQNNVSLNVLGGYSYSLKGIEVGGMLNIIRKDMLGVQIGGLVNITGEAVKGVQFAGLFNNSRGSVSGVQAAGFSNLTLDSIQGVQLSGFSNISMKNVEGGQVSGFNNLAIENVKGVQIGGFSNFAKKKVSICQISGFGNFGEDIGGLQLAGFINIAKEVRSAQLSGFANIAYGTVAGLQLSSFINIAKEVDGCQISLFNVSDTVSGLAIGLVSFVRKGVHQIEISENEIVYTDILLKIGTRKLYNIFSFGVSPYHNNVLLAGFGVGTRKDIKNRYYADIELSSNIVLNAIVPDKYSGNIVKLNLDFGKYFLKHSGISIGPSFNLFLNNNKDSVFNSIIPEKLKVSEQINSSTKIYWLGARVSIRI